MRGNIKTKESRNSFLTLEINSARPKELNIIHVQYVLRVTNDSSDGRKDL